ncbi:hypothetical protein L0128_12095 [candidate division KSB1 bacterium]|nr:hypothetical protein [candidate division KSB1 bacterium]
MKIFRKILQSICIFVFSTGSLIFNIPVSPAQIPDIGSNLELWVDDYLIEKMTGTTLKLHSPWIFPPEKDAILGAYTTILFDSTKYRLYYRSVIEGYQGDKNDGHTGEITCYAESNDGIHWNYPKLNLIEINGSRENNVILYESPFCHNFTPFLDVKPGFDPQERYKALAGTHKGGGLVPFASADGIHWKKMQEKPIITHDGYAFDSQNTAFWSVTENCYVCYFRTWKTSKGDLRTISRTTSPDFINWTPSIALDPNVAGEHLYTSGTQPYFRAPHLYLAFPTRFMPERGNSTDVLFMSSRGGNKFNRLFLEAFIRPGLDSLRWGNRANYAALNIVPTSVSEMSIYLCSGNAPMQRGVLRTDGIISVNATSKTGELLTKPFIFTGKRLVINFATSAAGFIQVEIQDEKGKPVPGYQFNESIEIIGDRIQQAVAWKKGTDVMELAGLPIRLHFRMKEADLYSFQFRK